ncbi:MAG: flagellar biosynthetic protein FliR [Nitrospiraceae bacterium]|nr:flagellar biosynthetic protein FliR [Nitrospiraceae bacterium]
MDTANINLFAAYLPNFLFILLRAGIVLGFLPFFSSSTFPAKFKIGFVVALSIVLTPVIQFKIPDRGTIAGVIVREMILAVALGMAARAIFWAIDMSGQIMSTAMGLSMATVFNPDMGQSTEFAQLYGTIAMLVFLALNIHHELIYAFVKSYEWIPLGSINTGKLMAAVVPLGGKMIAIALKISAPVIIIMLILNLLLGFLYKAAPQMNIFFIGYPLYMIVGFTLMILALPVFIYVFQCYFTQIKTEMLGIMAAAKG